MTPLAIEMLLHYISCADDFRNLRMPAQQELISTFLREDLLKIRVPSGGEPVYVITERGRAFCEGLQNMPLPKWMPGRWVCS